MFLVGLGGGIFLAANSKVVSRLFSVDAFWEGFWKGIERGLGMRRGNKK